MLCIRWYQKSLIYFELLKLGETINAMRNQEQLINLNQALEDNRAEYTERHDKIISQHGNDRPHVAKFVKQTLE